MTSSEPCHLPANSWSTTRRWAGSAWHHSRSTRRSSSLKPSPPSCDTWPAASLSQSIIDVDGLINAPHAQQLLAEGTGKGKHVVRIKPCSTSPHSEPARHSRNRGSSPEGRRQVKDRVSRLGASKTPVAHPGARSGSLLVLPVVDDTPSGAEVGPVTQLLSSSSAEGYGPRARHRSVSVRAVGSVGSPAPVA